MKPSVGAAAAVALWGPAAVVSASVVSMDIVRSNPEEQEGLSKRSTFVESLANNITGGAYYIDVKVGTPGTPARMVLDTGSSDAWIVSHEANLCTSRTLQMVHGDTCATTYDSAKSTSYALEQADGFSIRYLDGSQAKGDYIKDDFTVGGTTIRSMQIGLAKETVRGTGILGVGFSTHVAAPEQYPNIMDELVRQGLIPAKAYSLWLNDRRSPSGRILFGGVDTAKFIGALGVLPLIPDVSTGKITSFTVNLASMSIAFSNKTISEVPTRNASGVPALLDSGTTLSYLPAGMAEKVFRTTGAHTDTRAAGTGLTFVDCKQLDSERGLNMFFSFRGPGVNGGAEETTTIRVPVHEMVLDVIRGALEHLVPGNMPFAPRDTCLLGIQSTAGFASVASDLARSEWTLLGDTFLRSAYVVYDLDHKQVGLAQANLNATDSKVTELSNSTTAGLPRLSGVASQLSATPGPTILTTVTGTDGKPTVTVTDAASESNGAWRARGGGSGGDMLAVIAVSGLFALLGGAFMAF
ncbi:hypothetical protein RB597_008712 [Gaeumannomyces tritici]